MKALFGGQGLLVAQLLDALDSDVCPVCRLIADAERRQLDIMLHEAVNDERTRERLIASRGFCAAHTQLLLEVGGRGCHAQIALLYAAQAAALADDIANLPAQGDASERLLTSCPACETATRTEQLYVELIARRVSEPRFQTALTANGGPCLRHLNMVYGLADPTERAWLRQQQAGRMRALSNDLREFARKSAQSAQAEREAFGAERDAWLRILRIYDGDLPG